MHHLIFEGAELAGKSWIMSQIYDRLEPKYNKSKTVLDGCHWFNSDVGVFGTVHGKPIVEHYLAIAEELKDNNLLFEKLHISDIVYSRLHFKKEIDYKNIENRLRALNFKIIFITFKEDKYLLQQRINDRLNLYPHYKRILQNPDWYIEQQHEYMSEMAKTELPVLPIETELLPDASLVDQIMSWIGES